MTQGTGRCRNELMWMRIASGVFGAALCANAQPSQTRKSDVIVGFQWLGDEIEYKSPRPGEDPAKLLPVSPWLQKSGPQIHGDSFPMTWADDDEIYTSAGDPGWAGKYDGLDIEKLSGDPPNYTIARVNPMPDYEGLGGEGKKPTGMISVNGVLYLAFQNLLGPKPPAYGPQDNGKQGQEGKVSQHGSDAMIVSSRDHGRTWAPAIKGHPGSDVPR